MPTRLEQRVRLASYDNVLLAIPDPTSTVAVIVTHPWGVLGGNMYNNVVAAAVIYFQQKLGLTTVRFNFVGTQLGRGYIQVQQVVDIATSLLRGEHLINQYRSSSASSSTSTPSTPPWTPPQYILLVGYSYGSLITASASADIPADNILGCISIAPPFSVQHWLLCFASQAHMQRAATHLNVPRLFILGSHDDFTHPDVLLRIVQQHFPLSVSATTPTSAILKDADHFFRGREKDLIDIIGQWLLTTFVETCHGNLKRLRHHHHHQRQQQH